MRYGYKRPTVCDNDVTQQLVQVNLDDVHEERHGLAKNREVFEELLMQLTTGDELYVQNIEVLADSTQQLIDVLQIAERDEFTIIFLDECMCSTELFKKSLLDGLRYFSKLQSIFKRHASTFALQEAKKRGTVIGRPKKSDVQMQRAIEMYYSKQYTLHQIKEETGISKSTLYRQLDQ